MAGDVGPQSDGEAFTEQDVAVFGTLSVVDPDLVAFQVNVSDLYVTHFGDTDSSLKK